MRFTRVRSEADITAIETRVQSAAGRLRNALAEQSSSDASDLEFLLSLKFSVLGSHPVSGRRLNPIEQINQSAHYLVAAQALRTLLRLHPGLAFQVGLATDPGHDIESDPEGDVAAEVFAVVKRGNNRKLSKDLERLVSEKCSAKYRYVFFAEPGVPAGRLMEYERPGVQVWAIELGDWAKVS